MLKTIFTILEEKKHYLETLIRINKVLTKEFPNLVESNFFFKRQNEIIKAVSFERKKQLEVDSLTFLVKKIGEWTIGKEIAFTEYERKALEQVAHLISENIYFEEWEYSYKFCQNKGCKYFPCHKVKNENKFSCLFCYCPLYRLENCGGNYSLLENDVKNCIKCTLPHAEKNYDYIMKKLSLNT
ncbi:cysteine-rich small domain-containing protein [endosymbiont 'TC1' of Trimyema compressum]|uniref:cysteine-rich small domain-containing protein n=1 Tax=endosymbiont 'TC1' of Trimyema compressum TaxID=243899 RepID=UPI000B4C715B